MPVLLNIGFLVFGVTDYANKPTTAHYGAVTARDPREQGTRAAGCLLGKRLAEWVAVFCDGRKGQHPLHKSRGCPPGSATAHSRQSWRRTPKVPGHR